MNQAFLEALKKARKLLREKSYLEIQADTAWTWAARAAASYEVVEEGANPKLNDEVGPLALYGWLMVGDEYRHEALEHAALVEDQGKLLQQVQQAIDKARRKARTLLASKFE